MRQLRTSKRPRVGARGHANRVLEEFALPRIVAAYEELYGEALASHV